MRQIINMETIILDTMTCILGRIDPNMVLSSVQHMGHTKALEVGNVTHCFSIPNYYARKHLDKEELLICCERNKKVYAINCKPGPRLSIAYLPAKN